MPVRFAVLVPQFFVKSGVAGAQFFLLQANRKLPATHKVYVPPASCCHPRQLPATRACDNKEKCAFVGDAAPKVFMCVPTSILAYVERVWG